MAKQRQSHLEVISTPSVPDPPKALARAGRDLWIGITRNYRGDYLEVEILKRICVLEDRGAEITAVIDREGVSIMMPNGPRAHPLIREETNIRGLVAKLLKQLLDIDRPVRRPGRPPRSMYDEAMIHGKV
jgi:hypothetical protein